MGETRVVDVMTRTPVTVKRGQNVYEAASIILTHKVSGVAVVDDDGMLVGMLSELDCLRAIVVSAYDGGDPGGALVSDIMTPQVDTNEPDDDVLVVAKSMLKDKHRRRPVVDNGEFVGQLTCRQILRAVTEMIDKQETGN